jgi:hypothetical protein
MSREVIFGLYWFSCFRWYIAEGIVIPSELIRGSNGVCTETPAVFEKEISSDFREVLELSRQMNAPDKLNQHFRNWFP